MPHWPTLPLAKKFSAYETLFDSILPTAECLSKLESIFPNSATVFSTKFIYYFNNVHNVFSKNTFHLKKPFSLFVRSYSFRFHHEIIVIQSHIQAPLLITVLFLFSPLSAVTSSIDVLGKPCCKQVCCHPDLVVPFLEHRESRFSIILKSCRIFSRWMSIDFSLKSPATLAPNMSQPAVWSGGSQALTSPL